MKTIGIISDTHGLLRPQALDALQGSHLILHAGDVGDPFIVQQLREIAPVRAIVGNTDYGTLRGALPETLVVDLASADGAIPADWAPPGDLPAGSGPLAYILHDLEDLDLDPPAAGIAMVVSGHTHRPVIHERDGVLYLNPGSAGPRRFDLPVTLAKVTLEGGRLDAEIVQLSV